jgi:hypothetical protein
MKMTDNNVLSLTQKLLLNRTEALAVAAMLRTLCQPLVQIAVEADLAS